MERNVLKERLVNKDDKNRHFVLLIIDSLVIETLTTGRMIHLGTNSPPEDVPT